jgi:enoyl-CoA hydratase
MPSVIVEQRSNVLHMGLNDDNLRAVVLYAHGDNFTAGLDLAEVGPRLVQGSLDWPADARNPWRNDGRPWSKPVIAAVHGWCMTLGIELLLAADAGC